MSTVNNKSNIENRSENLKFELQIGNIWTTVVSKRINILLTEVVKGKLLPTRLETATEDGIENGWLLVLAEDETAATNVEPTAIGVTDEADDTGVGGGELRTSDKEFA